MSTTVVPRLPRDTLADRYRQHPLRSALSSSPRLVAVSAPAAYTVSQHPLPRFSRPPCDGRAQSARIDFRAPNRSSAPCASCTCTRSRPPASTGFALGTHIHPQGTGSALTRVLGVGVASREAAQAALVSAPPRAGMDACAWTLSLVFDDARARKCPCASKNTCMHAQAHAEVFAWTHARTHARTQARGHTSVGGTRTG